MRRTMLLALPAAALVLAGCAGSPATPEEAVAIEKKAMSEGIDRQMMPLYVTTWLEPVPAQFGRQQGFILDEGGSAESVNMATLKYESWQVADRKLTLRGKSIGNGGTFPFEEVWNVVMVSKKKLVLQRGGVYKTYWAPVREEWTQAFARNASFVRRGGFRERRRLQKCGRLFFRGRQKTSPLSSGSSSANVSRSSPGCLAGSSACHCRGQASSGTGRTSFGSS